MHPLCLKMFAVYSEQGLKETETKLSLSVRCTRSVVELAMFSLFAHNLSKTFFFVDPPSRGDHVIKGQNTTLSCY